MSSGNCHLSFQSVMIAVVAAVCLSSTGHVFKSCRYLDTLAVNVWAIAMHTILKDGDTPGNFIYWGSVTRAMTSILVGSMGREM